MALAQVARTELLVAGVAVDLKASVQLEKDASTTCTESPWAQDMTADMVVSQAPIQSEELVPPRSVARRQLSLSYYHALSRILSAAEAAQARVYWELDPEQQTILLSAGGLASKSQCIVLHKFVTDILRTAQRRVAAALRIGMPDVGPRATCALPKGAEGQFCDFSLRRDPYHPYCCKYGVARTRPHRAVLCTLQKLIEQAGRYADKERHVPGSTTGPYRRAEQSLSCAVPPFDTVAEATAAVFGRTILLDQTSRDVPPSHQNFTWSKVLALDLPLN